MPGRMVGVYIGGEESIIRRIFADQIGMRELVGRHVEGRSPSLVMAISDIMGGAGIIVGTERLHQVRVLGNVCEAVECRRPFFVVSVVNEMGRSRLFIGAERVNEV